MNYHFIDSHYSEPICISQEHKPNQGLPKYKKKKMFPIYVNVATTHQRYIRHTNIDRPISIVFFKCSVINPVLQVKIISLTIETKYNKLILGLITPFFVYYTTPHSEFFSDKNDKAYYFRVFFSSSSIRWKMALLLWFGIEK